MLGQIEKIEGEERADIKEVKPGVSPDILETLIAVRKFFNRLPDEWFPELLSSFVDVAIDKAKEELRIS